MAINDAADNPVKPAAIPLLLEFFFCMSSSWFKPGPKMLYATHPRTGANTKKMAILPSIPAKLPTTSSGCAANDDCAKPSVDVATVATFAASTFVSVDCTCKRARIFARNVSFCLASLGSNPIPRKKKPDDDDDEDDESSSSSTKQKKIYIHI